MSSHRNCIEDALDIKGAIVVRTDRTCLAIPLNIYTLGAVPRGHAGQNFSDADFDRVRETLRWYIVSVLAAIGADRLGDELIRAAIADFDGYVVPALLMGRSPRHFAMTDFCARINWDRKNTYENKIKTWIFLLETIAAAMPMAEHSQRAASKAACLMEETLSPVGDNAKGPGVWPPDVSSRNKTQILLGAMFTGPFHLYTNLAAPRSADLHPTSLAEQVMTLIEPWGAAADAVRAMADLESGLLECLGLDPRLLRKYEAPGTILVPRLKVGPVLIGGGFDSISADPEALAKAFQAQSGRFPRRAIVECLGDWDPEEPLKWRQPDEIRKILGWSVEDTPFTSSTNTEYALDRSRGMTRLHRKVDEGDHASTSMAASRASFVLIDFDFQADGRKALADAISAIERLASRSPATACALAFGRELAPARIGPRNPAISSLVYLTRSLAYSALTIIAGRSESDES
jgi:hypothetical protein